MKKIYLLVLQGKAFRDDRYNRSGKFDQENPLIYTGHLGISFEGDEGRIFGFRPTDQEINRVGGIKKAFDLLLEQRGTLEGSVYDDYDAFERAYNLAQNPDPPPYRDTTVYRHTEEVSDTEFERIYTLVMAWYNNKTTFTYSFPPDNPPLPPDKDNCASFIRKLNLPILDPQQTGQISRCVKVFQNQQMPDKWKPEKNKNAADDPS